MSKQKPIILPGGVDIDSKRYNEVRSKYAQSPDVLRDTYEFLEAERAIEEGKPIVGICRGAQLLCILNGGKLYQHTIPREGQQHPIAVKTEDGVVNILHTRASHHQIMRPEGEYEVYAWNPTPTDVYVRDNEKVEMTGLPEVIWFPKIKGLAIQPHPEWNEPNHPFVVWVNKLMYKLEIDFQF